MNLTRHDRDDFDELVRHPKYARIVADLVADVNLISVVKDSLTTDGPPPVTDIACMPGWIISGRDPTC